MTRNRYCACCALVPASRFAEWATDGFGNQDPSYKGTVGIAKVHGDMVLVSPTVYLDGVVMCENNKLNPDLGLGGL